MFGWIEPQKRMNVTTLLYKTERCEFKTGTLGNKLRSTDIYFPPNFFVDPDLLAW